MGWKEHTAGWCSEGGSGCRVEGGLEGSRLPTAIGGIAVVTEVVVKNRKGEAQRGEDGIPESQAPCSQDSP